MYVFVRVKSKIVFMCKRNSESIKENNIKCVYFKVRKEWDRWEA